MQKRNFLQAAFLSMLLILIVASVMQAEQPEWVKEEKERITKTTIIETRIEKDLTSTIDWDGRYVEVTAKGMSADCPNTAACIVQSEEVARIRAYKMLASTVEGIAITAETTIRDEIKLGSITEGIVKAFIKGARVVDTTYETVAGNIMTTVKLGFLLDDPTGFSKMVIPKVKSRIEKKPPKIYEPTQDEIAKTVIEEEYTGIIVDTSGLNVKPAIYPNIVTEEGEIVYSGIHVDDQFAIATGIIGYARTMEKAKINETRIGKNPMVIKAIGVKGQYKADVVISKEDAVKILNLNNAQKIFEKCAIVFVID